MDVSRNRKYPRVHDKNIDNKDKQVITLSGTAAAVITAAVFLEGILWGYLLKRSLD